MAMINAWAACLAAGTSYTRYLVLGPYSGAFSLDIWHDWFSNLLHNYFAYSTSIFTPMAVNNAPAAC